MTTHAFIIPAHATPDDIEAARPTGAGDSRCHSEPLESPYTSDLAAVNTMTEPMPVPDPERRLRALVAAHVNPLVYDYQRGYTSFRIEEFHAAVMIIVREYAEEEYLDADAAEAEARRLLEMLL